MQVATSRAALLLVVGAEGRLYQLAFGARDAAAATPARPSGRFAEFYPQAGDGYICEPALQITHADGNTSTALVYEGDETQVLDTNLTLTRIALRDAYYPLQVTLWFKAYQAEDIIEAWTAIKHAEAGPVTLHRFASAAPLVAKADSYWLTHFHGDWAMEAKWVEERLSSGMKVLDSKIGVRAHQYRTPGFVLSLGGEAREEQGEVLAGTLAWSGSFQFVFELDVKDRLRVLAGINPFGSQYILDPGKTFTTPAMLWTWSGAGKGPLSRNFHRWARRYGIRDGDEPRPILLNNWEATGFHFDEPTIVSLFDGAGQIGADTFLLDDGWFGNRHPRNDARAGLGDWQVNTNKLPHGLSFLAEEARKPGRGGRFGIWIEPEMVNPASDLFEQHPDWVIRQPHREMELSRNQLTLDLTRPEVHEFAWRSIDDLLTANPGISYLKWDANRYVTQPGSPYLSPDRQSHLLIDYNFALYDVMARMAAKHPHVMAMLCSGGGGRVDYGALKYFHTFWPSDNTDPRARVFIQWGFSHFFPAPAIAAHVTHKGGRPLKFACDVAMSGALGFDLDVRKLSAAERHTLAAATSLYKQRLREVVSLGDLYRLESPYANDRAALAYVLPDRSRAVLFVYQLKNADARAVPLRGLDAARRYRVREVNLPTEGTSALAQDGQTQDGTVLMRDGLIPACGKEFDSAIIEFDATDSN